MVIKSLERVEEIVYSRVIANSMANRRAERIKIAGVEGVSRRADYFVFGGVAMF